MAIENGSAPQVAAAHPFRPPQLEAAFVCSQTAFGGNKASAANFPLQSTHMAYTRKRLALNILPV
jgi:hypothetical protein